MVTWNESPITNNSNNALAAPDTRTQRLSFRQYGGGIAAIFNPLVDAPPDPPPPTLPTSPTPLMMMITTTAATTNNDNNNMVSYQDASTTQALPTHSYQSTNYSYKSQRSTTRATVPPEPSPGEDSNHQKNYGFYDHFFQHHDRSSSSIGDEVGEESGLLLLVGGGAEAPPPSPVRSINYRTYVLLFLGILCLLAWNARKGDRGGGFVFGDALAREYRSKTRSATSSITSNTTSGSLNNEVVNTTSLHVVIVPEDSVKDSVEATINATARLESTP